MGKLFGTDGIRGVVGETLTAELAYRVGQAITIVLTEQKGSAPTITIGKDTRISSDMLESALMAGICAMGGSVMPFGTIPTPAVAFLTVQEEADAGIVISASHNPYEHNGIKIFGAQGYKLSDEMEEKVENIVLSKESLPVKTRDQVRRRPGGAGDPGGHHRGRIRHPGGCIRAVPDAAGLSDPDAPGPLRHKKSI